jgi:hypothetical protein
MIAFPSGLIFLSIGGRATGRLHGHCETLGPEGEPELVSSIGMKRSDTRRFFAEVVARRDGFLLEWGRIHG